MAGPDPLKSALDTADELSEESQRVLGSNLVAVVLHGSLVSDDFAGDRSDIDLLLIVGTPLADQQRHGLADSSSLQSVDKRGVHS